MEQTTTTTTINYDEGITTPFSITLTKMGDFLKLEKVLRYLLQCQGKTCSFLQSADYVSIKLAATHALRGCIDKNPPPKIVYIPQSTLMIHLLDDKSTIIIREQALCGLIKPSSSAPSTKKRKLRATKSTVQNDDDDDELINHCEDDRHMEGPNDLKHVSSLETKFMLAKQRSNNMTSSP
jgi:hypothetical protein